MRVDVICLFPSIFRSPLEEGILKRARKRGFLEIRLHNLRDFSLEKHRRVDDAPFGGGGGMVLEIEPIYRALEKVKKETKELSPQVILLSPQGEVFSQELAKKLAKEKALILICGRYEGVDERVREHLVDREISIGDYVLTGGEIPALVVIDAVARLIPGVVGKEKSFQEDSFYRGLLDYPHYTRPRVFQGWKVPEVLLSGDHLKIERWRKKKMLELTLKKRPELLQRARLSPEEKKILEEIKREKGLKNAG